MPELPDVELLRRYVDATALHQPIAAVRVDAPRMLEGVTPKELRAHLEGAALEATRRHGKYLLIALSRGPWLVLHFGMTGRLDYARSDAEPPRHTRLVMEFAHGYRLAGVWQRRLGKIALARDPASFVAQRDLGPDALDLGLADFRERLAGRRGAIKPALLDQSLLAGIGNVYGDEILFRARLRPDRAVRSLDRRDLGRLHRAMRHVLRLAIERCAEPAQMPDSWLLRQRHSGARCPRCGAGMAQATTGGRHGWYCPACQR